MIALKLAGPFNWVFQQRLEMSAHVEVHRGAKVYNGLQIPEGIVLIIPLDENSRQKVDQQYGSQGRWIEI